VQLSDLVRYLDEYLHVRDIADERFALNGLQVANSGEVREVAATVDACQATIDAAAEGGADLLLVHHGLFWGGLEPLTGRSYRRVASLLRHDVAVYSSHLPLDRHPDVGNNAVLARKLGVSVRGSFGEYLGAPIGLWGELDTPRDALRAVLGEVLGSPARLIAGGPERCRRVGIITGAAGSSTREAAEAGLDTFVTGEGQHWTYFDAEEFGVNVLHAGHYATETLGIQALATHIAERFHLPWSFIDYPTGL
jgi:dinuclear metal center YbgI/SA1388 family protein